jgi:hypothetical protein
MTLPRAAFARAVRRLDGDDARGLVADLLEARGYRTTVDGDVVTATRDTAGEGRTGPSTRVRVVGGFRAAATAPADGADVVLVTGGPIARTLGSFGLRSRAREGPAGPTRPGVDTLYEWFAFAVDGGTRATLEERYLDRTDPSALERGWLAAVRAADATERRLDRLSTPSWRVAGVVLVVLLALVAGTAAGPGGLLASPGASGPTTPADGAASTRTPRVTAVPTTATPVATATAAGPPLPDACPPAPTGTHPASLRPAVRQTATAGGLDGWRILVDQNVTKYAFDPNDQQADVVPELRHIAVFERPGGAQFRLGIDRWASPNDAARSIARGGPWGLGVLWGSYTAWVEWGSSEAGGITAARQLLASVTTPEGVRLGGACVSALATGPATDDGSGAGDTDATTTTPHVSGQARGGWTPRLPRTGP